MSNVISSDYERNGKWYGLSAVTRVYDIVQQRIPQTFLLQLIENQSYCVCLKKKDVELFLHWQTTNATHAAKQRSSNEMKNHHMFRAAKLILKPSILTN